MNPPEYVLRGLWLGACCAFLLAGCVGSEPSEREIKDQIQSELLRMTDNRLFDVEAIEIQAGTADPNGTFHITAISTLKFKRSIPEYVDWMLTGTTVPKTIKPDELRRALVEKLAAKYGSLQPGQTGAYRRSFQFTKQRFGWQLRSKDEDKPIF